MPALTTGCVGCSLHKTTSFAAVYVMTEIGVFSLDAAALGILADVLAVIDVWLLFASRATFRREEILTSWT